MKSCSSSEAAFFVRLVTQDLPVPELKDATEL